jgi:hypothetical protein
VVVYHCDLNSIDHRVLAEIMLESREERGERREERGERREERGERREERGERTKHNLKKCGCLSL